MHLCYAMPCHAVFISIYVSSCLCLVACFNSIAGHARAACLVTNIVCGHTQHTLSMFACSKLFLAAYVVCLLCCAHDVCLCDLLGLCLIACSAHSSATHKHIPTHADRQGMATGIRDTIGVSGCCPCTCCCREEEVMMVMCVCVCESERKEIIHIYICVCV